MNKIANPRFSVAVLGFPYTGIFSRSRPLFYRRNFTQPVKRGPYAHVRCLTALTSLASKARLGTV